MITVLQRVRIPLNGIGCPVDFITFRGFEQQQHFALHFHGSEPAAGMAPLVRVHSECMTGDTFGSLLCDCGPQLQEAQQRMGVEGGILLYLRQEGRGIGLYAKLQAYALQQEGLDTFAANRHLNLPEDGRDFKSAADMLNALGVNAVRLLTNNPDKVTQLTQHHIRIDAIIPTGVYLNHYNQKYLAAKQQLKAHTISVVE